MSKTDDTASGRSGRFDSARAREAGRLGGLKSGESRRERAKTHRQRVQEYIEANYELLFDAFTRGMRDSDANKAWQAAAEISNQGFGKPAQEITGPDGSPLLGDGVEQAAQGFRALMDALAARHAAELEQLEQGTNSPRTAS